MKGIKPSEIFNAFLLDKSQRGQTIFPYDFIDINKAFYEAYLKNRKIMQNYDFEKKINPYSSTLQHLIEMSHLVGRIMIGMDGLIYIKNLDRINNPAKKIKKIARDICSYLEANKNAA